MKILIDTQLLIWATEDTLSYEAIQYIDDVENTLFLVLRVYGK